MCCRYTAGKVPKAFKIIPVLSNWEEVLYLTDPEKWSAHAVYQATRLFISNLNAKMVRGRRLAGGWVSWTVSMCCPKGYTAVYLQIFNVDIIAGGGFGIVPAPAVSKAL